MDRLQLSVPPPPPAGDTGPGRAGPDSGSNERGRQPFPCFLRPCDGFLRQQVSRVSTSILSRGAHTAPGRVAVTLPGDWAGGRPWPPAASGALGTSSAVLLPRRPPQGRPGHPQGGRAQHCGKRVGSLGVGHSGRTPRWALVGKARDGDPVTAWRGRGCVLSTLGPHKHGLGMGGRLTPSQAQSGVQGGVRLGMPLWLRSPRSPPCVPHADPSLSPLGAPGGVSVAAPARPATRARPPARPPWPPRPHHREPAPAPQGAVGSGRRGPVPCAERCWALGPGLWVLHASSPGSRARWARRVRSATRQ